MRIAAAMLFSFPGNGRVSLNTEERGMRKKLCGLEGLLSSATALESLMQLQRNQASCFLVSTRVSDSEFNHNRNWNLNLTFHCCEALGSLCEAKLDFTGQIWSLLFWVTQNGSNDTTRGRGGARKLQKPGSAGATAGSWALCRALLQPPHGSASI